MDRMDFSQAVIRVKVLEKRLLDRPRLERMVEAPGIEEVLKVLAETEYQQAMAGVTRPEDYEMILAGELKRVYGLLSELTKETVLPELLSLKYDYHNLKVLVKEDALKKSLKDLYVPVGTRDVEKVKSAYLSEDYSDVEPRVKAALLEAKADFESTGDPQRIDILLDRHYFDHLLALSKETGIPLFEAFVRDLIDFTNLKTLIRVKKMEKDLKFLEEVLLPGGTIEAEEILYSINESLEEIMHRFRNARHGAAIREGLEAFRKSQRLSEFEKIMDNRLMKLQEPSRSIIFGPEPLFSYLYAKEAEIKALRIIMVSKINQLSPEVIRERLRDLYV